MVGSPHCLNCEQPITGEYCSACGQRNVDHRRPLWALLRELVAESFELDGRMRRTLRPFLLRPGFLTREFRDGRRVRYTSPLRLYIATSLLFFSLVALKQCTGDVEGLEIATPVIMSDDDVDTSKLSEVDDDDPIGQRLRAIAELPPEEGRKRVIAGFTSHMPKALLLLVPVFAGIVGLLTIGRGFLYVDHLVFALHVHALWFLALALAVVLPSPFGAVLRLAMAVYGVVAFKRAYELRWWPAIWRVLVGSILYGITLLVAILAITVGTLWFS
ncbi:MAG TPA: DUF3667 domain-containing protein [Nannocystaceae bacterium]|nr:DUF3667 domain-containing protein [Nannocystaceae bacterium]